MWSSSSSSTRGLSSYGRKARLQPQLRWYSVRVWRLSPAWPSAFSRGSPADVSCLVLLRVRPPSRAPKKSAVPPGIARIADGCARASMAMTCNTHHQPAAARVPRAGLKHSGHDAHDVSVRGQWSTLLHGGDAPIGAHSWQSPEVPRPMKRLLELTLYFWRQTLRLTAAMSANFLKGGRAFATAGGSLLHRGLGYVLRPILAVKSLKARLALGTSAVALAILLLTYSMLLNQRATPPTATIIVLI